ncbi:hypothetical protein BCR36DRAFT_130874 [Piromyces finnis]|uniref:Uncharacterized protein n=1 Tax=Piromyces finnis TaxID=1754191 RepID=A0A1Y1UZS0_9FUNG|nr:hypothetical protein BCR36DRAFT_130874 [Piromyces finnis]|eukprot:ORX44226.1 hypothetical protein BCR36DRAFT_130874 [Piromyces finnis]
MMLLYSEISDALLQLLLIMFWLNLEYFLFFIELNILSINTPSKLFTSFESYKKL